MAPLLVTSDAAYSKIDMNSTNIDFEEGDISGPFNLGLTITENYNDVESKIVVYGSAYIIEESMLNYTSIGNMNLFINSVNFLADRESSIAVPTRSVVQEYLTLNAAQVNFWGAVVVVVIPVLVLTLGGFICLRRRKK
jgi:ABC-2 type transport system permease protein